MNNTTAKRTTTALGSIILCWMHIAPTQAAIMQDPIMGTDTPAHRTILQNNIQTLEREIVGAQLENQTKVHQAYNPKINPTPIKSYATAIERAKQLGMDWIDPATWGEAEWQTKTATKHSGPEAQQHTPLSRNDYGTQAPDAGQLVADPTDWTVCRVAMPEGTYHYGIKKSKAPNCTLGDPSTMQWNPDDKTWKIPYQHGEQNTRWIPRHPGLYH